jgi:hypothetical protein
MTTKKDKQSDAAGDRPVVKASLPVETARGYSPKNPDLRQVLYIQSGFTTPNFSEKEDPKAIQSQLNASAALTHEMAPRDAVEMLLCNQMAAVHHLTMRIAKIGLNEDSSIEALERLTGLVSRLSRAYTAQVETLATYRGKGKQEVNVKHVHVNQGGQAIIGRVTGGGGREHSLENSDLPHAKRENSVESEGSS